MILQEVKHIKEAFLNKKFKKILIIILPIIIFLSIFLIIFNNKTAKNFKIGNTKSSQEIVDNILNISSYEAQIEVEVKSNKNTNKYIIKQKYIKPDILEQEIIEPENIKGLKVIKNGKETKIENTKINLTKIFNEYEELTGNYLDLITFIEEYKENSKTKFEEKNNEIIMKTESEKNLKYQKYKNLYIDIKTGNPTKLEVKDNNKDTVVYILYNKVKLNM